MQRRNSSTAIVVFGVSGSGKSTVGRRLAEALGAVFVEGDDYHTPAAIAKMHAGTPLTDDDRWPWLERLGHAVAARNDRDLVLACSALRRSYRDALVRAARCDLTFIHLAVDAQVLEARLRRRPGHFMPASLLASQLATLEPLGRDERGATIRAHQAVEETVAAIVRRFGLAYEKDGRPSRPSREEEETPPA